MDDGSHGIGNDAPAEVLAEAQDSED